MPLSKKKVRWPRMSYDSFRRVRQIFATAAITFAIVVIWRFAHAAPGSLKTTRNGVAILFWTLGPPVWFFLEYWELNHEKHRPPKKGRVEIEIGKEKSGSKDPPLHGTT